MFGLGFVLIYDSMFGVGFGLMFYGGGDVVSGLVYI